MNVSVPTNFNDFIINKKKVDILSTFNKHNLSNILLYGHPNTGKKTLVYSFIQHLFSNETLTIHQKEDALKYKNKHYTCKYTYTKYYYDIDLLENIKSSKYIINDFINNICSNTCIEYPYRILIIHNLNVLDKNLIKSLLHIIEKYYKHNKFILLFNTPQIILFNKINSYFFTLRCNIDKDELSTYIKDKKVSKKIKSIICSCNNLYYINLLLEFKTLQPYDPIQIYIVKIYKIIKKYNTILFLEKIRELIYEFYLLDFKLSHLIQHFIRYVIHKQKNIPDDTVHILYHLCAKYDPTQPQFFQPFTLVETFFIEVKQLNIC